MAYYTLPKEATAAGVTASTPAPTPVTSTTKNDKQKDSVVNTQSVQPTASTAKSNTDTGKTATSATPTSYTLPAEAVKAGVTATGTAPTVSKSSSTPFSSPSSPAAPATVDPWAASPAPAAPAPSAGEVLDQAEEYGRKFGQREAQRAGDQSIGYARAAGLSPAQAALMAAQGAGTAYSSGVSSGTAGGLQGILGNKGLDVQKYGIDKGYESGQADRDQQNQNNIFGAVGSGLSALGGMLFSDKGLKTDIKDGYGVLKAVTDQVTPKSFKYRGDGTTRQGIMAQDLEKTPLAYTVQNTPDGKMVDTSQLTAANTGMISELSKKLDTVTKYLKAGGK